MCLSFQMILSIVLSIFLFCTCEDVLVFYMLLTSLLMGPQANVRSKPTEASAANASSFNTLSFHCRSLPIWQGQAIFSPDKGVVVKILSENSSMGKTVVLQAQTRRGNVKISTSLHCSTSASPQRYSCSKNCRSQHCQIDKTSAGKERRRGILTT